MAGRLLDLGFRAAPNPPDRTAINIYAPDPIGFWNPLWSGFGRIEGVATFDAAPGPARVLLMQDSTKRIVRATEAASDGAYAFANLATDQTFTVIGEDPSGTDNSVIQARVTPGVPE